MITEQVADMAIQVLKDFCKQYDKCSDCPRKIIKPCLIPILDLGVDWSKNETK